MRRMKNNEGSIIGASLYLRRKINQFDEIPYCAAWNFFTASVKRGKTSKASPIIP